MNWASQDLLHSFRLQGVVLQSDLDVDLTTRGAICKFEVRILKEATCVWIMNVSHANPKIRHDSEKSTENPTS